VILPAFSTLRFGAEQLFRVDLGSSQEGRKSLEIYQVNQEYEDE